MIRGTCKGEGSYAQAQVFFLTTIFFTLNFFNFFIRNQYFDAITTMVPTPQLRWRLTGFVPRVLVLPHVSCKGVLMVSVRRPSD